MKHIVIKLDFENEEELKQTIFELDYLQSASNTYFCNFVTNLIYKLEEHLK